MPLKPLQDPAADPLVSRPRRASRPVMLGGVAAACLLGAGLGLWARPSDLERDLAPRQAARPQARPAPQAGPPQQIEIRVGGAASAAAAQPATPAPVIAKPPPVPAPTPELIAPKPRSDGLVRVRAVAPARLQEAPRPKPNPVAPPATKAAHKAEEAQAKAEAAKRAREEARAAGVRKTARLEKARIAAAEAAGARKREAQKLAESEAAARRQQTRLAQARAERRREAKLVKTKAAASQAAIRPARTPTPQRLHANPAPIRSGGPLQRVNARCASDDPGAALACADPALGAADRQLTRAYRRAQSAGVPSERLERQQQHWLAARANAARQAPWAVHDIYLARIAELQDQTLQASRGD